MTIESHCICKWLISTIVDLNFHASALDSIQSLKKPDSQYSKMQSDSSLVKTVIWESVYERCDS